MPRAVLLTPDEAIGQAAHVVFPGRVVHHGQHEAGGVDVAVLHQPPPVVVLLGAEDHFGALVADATAQNLAGFSQAFVALRHVLDAGQNVVPVNDRMGRPLVRGDGDAR